jgi:hypothetical protein
VDSVVASEPPHEVLGGAPDAPDDVVEGLKSGSPLTLTN